MDKKVTSLEELKNYSRGSVVEFPPFGVNQPFVARVRRPSMLVLAKQGKIPNALLTSASELFAKGGDGMDTDNPQLLEDMYGVCHLMAEATLVEPTLAEIEDAGLTLTDDQMMAIFNYSQVGIQALDSFRTESTSNENNQLTSRE